MQSLGCSADGQIVLTWRLWGDVALQLRVCMGIVINWHNAPDKHPLLIFLDYTIKFHKWLAVDIRVDCGALKQEVHKQYPFSAPKSLSIFSEQKTIWISSLRAVKCVTMPWVIVWVQTFRTFGLLSDDNTAQEVIPLLSESCQKSQCTCLLYTSRCV